MKSSDFKRSDGLWVQYRRPREGPPSYLVYTPGKSFICLTDETLLEALEDRPEGLEDWLATMKNQQQDHATDQSD